MNEALQTCVPLRVARHGMVSCCNALVSGIGLDILRSGGNAVDAVIAMGIAISVAEPYNSHLGGDVFLQYWNASSKQLFTMNSDGPSPANLDPKKIGDQIPLRGIASATVPGAVDGWLKALRHWGTMSPHKAFAPAIQLAEDGYALPWSQIQLYKKYKSLWNQYPDTAELIIPDSDKEGAVIYQPALANTLRDITDGGRAAFYEGGFAEKLCKYSDEHNGYFTPQDLSGFKAQILDPVMTTYHGYTVTGQPPISQNVLMLEMLNILEPYDLSRISPESADAIHLISETKKLVFADRDAHFGDQWDISINNMVSKRYAERQRRRINTRSASVRHQSGKLVENGADTTCLCAIDSKGNAAVMIQSLCHAFGCGVSVPGTGVILNNRITAFNKEPGTPNAIAPSKRPVNSLCTFMIFHGDDLLTIGGTPGGDDQILTNVQLIMQIIDGGRNPQEAIESPKWRIDNDSPGLTLEERMPLETCYDLRKLGYQLTVAGPWSAPCSCQCIAVDLDNGSLLGATDPRSDGLAIGY